MGNTTKGSTYSGIIVPSKMRKLSSLDEVDKIIDDTLQMLQYLVEKLKTEPQWSTGMVTRYAGVLPNGFLECDGSAVSRTKYVDLFREIGDTYGSGDGTTTFNLPAMLSGTAVLTGSVPFCIKY